MDLVHRAPAAAGDEGYEYHQMLTSDLDGDGTDETAHLVASVQLLVPSIAETEWPDGR